LPRRSRWEELEKLETHTLVVTSSTEDDRQIGMPANLRDIYSLIVLDASNERASKLIRKTARQWDLEIGATDYFDRDLPRIYTRYQEMIEVHPVYDSAYVLRARCCLWPTAFSDSSPSATSELDQKDDMLIALSNSWIFATLKMTDNAKYWWGIYRNMLNSALDEEAEKPDLDRVPGRGSTEVAVLDRYWLDPFTHVSP